MAKILIIDDEEGVRKLLREILVEEGHEVVMAENGREGMAHFESQSFDLVITDLIMPEQEGVETIQKVLSHKPQTKIIAMSGGGVGDKETYLSVAKKLGAREIFPKPLDFPAFVDSVNRLVSEEGNDEA